jgi:hypothetical protein
MSLTTTSPGLETLTMESLAPLPPNIRTMLLQEREVNRLRYDVTSNRFVVSIPTFREANFHDTSLLDEGNLTLSGFYSSSTFHLADVLQILPGQTRNTGTIFLHRSVLQPTNFQHLYCAPCSRIGLARLICRFFSSISEHGNVIRIRTTLGLFELYNERLGIFVHFSPEACADQKHPLAQNHFDNVKRFAQGSFDLATKATG